MLFKKAKTDIEILQEKLQEIKDQNGIIGYILRSPESASIDLKDPKKIIDYAVLSSTAFDAGRNITETLQMGEVDTIVVESEDTKLLSININNHHLSIFMEKGVDHNRVYKSLEQTPYFKKEFFLKSHLNFRKIRFLKPS